MELYKIAVSVQLRNMMHGALRTLRDDLGLTDRAVNRLQRNLQGLERTQQASARAASASATAQGRAQEAADRASASVASRRTELDRLRQEKLIREGAHQRSRVLTLAEAATLADSRAGVRGPSRRSLQTHLAANKAWADERLAPLLAERAGLEEGLGRLTADHPRQIKREKEALRQARRKHTRAKNVARTLPKDIDEILTRFAGDQLAEHPSLRRLLPEGLNGYEMPQTPLPKREHAAFKEYLLREAAGQHKWNVDEARMYEGIAHKDIERGDARRAKEVAEQEEKLARNKGQIDSVHSAHQSKDRKERDKHSKAEARAEKERHRILNKENATRERARKADEAHRRGQSAIDRRISAEELKEQAAAERKAESERKVTEEKKKQDRLRREELRAQREMATLEKAERAAGRRRMLGVGGLAGVVGGAVGLWGIGKLAKPGLDVAREEFLLKTTGATEAELAAIDAAAPGIMRKIPGLRADELRSSYLHVKQTFGLKGKQMTQEEIDFVLGQALPEIASSATALRILQPDKYQDLPNTIVALMRSMDIRALTQKEDYPALISELKLMSKMITASGGVITPMVMQGTLKYARQFAGTVGESFLYQYLPTLIQENMTAGGGGGGRGNVGTMLQSFGSMFIAGRMSRRAMRVWNELGVLPDESLIKDGNQVRVDSRKGFVNNRLMQENFGLWLQSEVVPRVIANLRETGVADLDGNMRDYDQLSPREQRKAVDDFLIRTPGNNTGMALMSALVRSWPSILRDENSRKLAMNYETLIRTAMLEDPDTLMTMLSAQWFNLRVAISKDFVPAIMLAGVALNDGMMVLTTLFQENPALAQGTMWTLAATAMTALAGGLVSLGFWVTQPIWKGLVLIAKGLGAVAGFVFSGAFAKLLVAGTILYGITSNLWELVTGVIELKNTFLDMVDLISAKVRDRFPLLYQMFGNKNDLLPGDPGYEYRSEANREAARKASIAPEANPSGAFTDSLRQEHEQLQVIQLNLDGDPLAQYIVGKLNRTAFMAGQPVGSAIAADPLSLADLGSAH